MAYEKNKQTPSRTLRYYHVQDYLRRPSWSHTKARTSIVIFSYTLDFQLAQAKLMVQRLQQQQAVASQQHNEAAPPSSASIPSTPVSEQGGAKPVVETEKK